MDSKKLKLEIETDISQVDAVMDGLDTHMKNRRNRQSEGSTSTGTSGFSKEVIESLNQDKQLENAIDKFRNKMFGADHVDDPQWRSKFQRDAQRTAKFAVEAYWKEVNKVMDSQEGMSLSKAQNIVSEQHGLSPEWINETMKKFAPDIAGQAAKGKGQEPLHTIGLYLTAGLLAQGVQEVFQYKEAEMRTGAAISTAEGLAFNTQSALGHTMIAQQTEMQNKIRELELQRHKSQMYGHLGGTLGMGALAGGLSLLATGGLSLPLIGAGMIIGGTGGSAIGSWLGTEDVTQEELQQIPQKQWLQLMAQMDPMMRQRVGAYDQLDVSNRRFMARFGGIGISGQGLGYTDDMLRQMQYGMGSIAGYDDDAFKSQLAFSRGRGLMPNDVFAANISTRFTGDKIGGRELMMREQMANATGMGERLPDLIKGLNDLSVNIGLLNTTIDDSELLGVGMLPSVLFGDTALGRMGDLGMRTIQGIQGIYQQDSGSAGDAFLFQSLYPMHKGNLRTFERLKHQGIFADRSDGEGMESFRNVISSIRDVGAGSDQGFWALQSLTKGNFPLADQLATMIDDPNIGVEEIMERWQEEQEKIAEGTENSNKILSDLLSEGKRQTSKAETQREEITRLLTDAGETLQSGFHDLEKALLEVQNKLIFDNIEQFFKEMRDAIKDMADFSKSIYGDKAKSEEREMRSAKWEEDLVTNAADLQKYERYVRPLLDKDVNKDKWRKVGVNQYKRRENSLYIFNPNEEEREGGKYPYLEIDSGFELFDNKELWLKDREERDFLIDKHQYENKINFERNKKIQKEWNWKDGSGQGYSSRDESGLKDVIMNNTFIINAADRAEINTRLDEIINELSYPRKF